MDQHIMDICKVKTLEAASFHEAGHVIMGTLRGIEVPIVQVVQNQHGGWDGRATVRTTFEPVETQLLVAAAGMAAELCYRFSNFADVPVSVLEAVRYTARSDLKRFELSAQSISPSKPDFDHYVAVECWRLLSKEKARLNLLARELISYKRVGGHVIEEIVLGEPLTVGAREKDQALFIRIEALQRRTRQAEAMPKRDSALDDPCQKTPSGLSENCSGYNDNRDWYDHVTGVEPAHA